MLKRKQQGGIGEVLGVRDGKVIASGQTGLQWKEGISVVENQVEMCGEGFLCKGTEVQMSWGDSLSDYGTV